MSFVLDRRIVHYYDLMWVLVGREMKLLYKRSALGVLWTLINPLLLLLVFVFIFRNVIRVDIPNYTSYVFTGLLVWEWFNRSVSQATVVIVGNRSLIRQPGFPLSVLPPAVVMTGMLHFVLALPVLIVFLLFDGVRITIAWLSLPLLLFFQFSFTLALGYLLAGLNVAFRDTQNGLNIVLRVMFYVTPIFYSVDQVPDKIRPIYEMNPMVPILTGYRSILIDGQSPSWVSLSSVVVMILLLLPVSFRLFRHQSRQFVEET